MKPSTCTVHFYDFSGRAGFKQASLMTGRHNWLTGMQYEVITPSAPWGLPSDEVLLSERFKAAGYKTHMVGDAGMPARHVYHDEKGCTVVWMGGLQ